MKRALFVTLTAALALAGCKKSAPTAEPATPPSSGSAEATAPAATGSAAAAADPWVKAPVAKDPIKRPFLWSITRDGKTTYAMGTIHVGIDAEARLPQLVWDKLEASPTFAMETDITDPSLQSITECVGCSLRRELGAEHWQKLEGALGKDVAARLDGMQPMVAATMMSLRALPPTTQMDSLLLARAQNAKKQVVYLEQASHAGAILRKWMNIKALKAMLDDLEAADANTKKMLAAYEAGDDVVLVDLANAEKANALKHGYTAAEYEESMRDLLYDRNAAWIAPIEKFHAAGGGFMAVGAMHLVGPQSVLEMLGKKGYVVTRLTVE